MGYDLKVTKGHVRLAEAPVLIRELLEFAAQMELEVILVNWMVSGIIPDHSDVVCQIFGDQAAAHRLVFRPVIKKTTLGSYQLP